MLNYKSQNQGNFMITDEYLGGSEYVGIPGDAPQKPFQAAKATAAGTKNTSDEKKNKKGERLQKAQESPAAVVVQSAGPLLQPLKEHPGQPHQSEDEGTKGSCAEVIDSCAVDCPRERMAESSLVPSPKPLREH